LNTLHFAAESWIDIPVVTFETLERYRISITIDENVRKKLFNRVLQTPLDTRNGASGVI